MLSCWNSDRHQRPTFAQLVTKLSSFENRINGIYEKDVEGASALYQSTSNLTGDTNGFSSSPAFIIPSPPSSLPPQLSFEDFLKINGLQYCQRQLEAYGIYSMAGLTQCSHSDLLSIGLPSDDAVTYCTTSSK
uniref:Ephrin receptor 1 SAM domain-containing protein n=1 Tax=Panagrolaimus superbus TaxID=310955 RepID=A0A914Y381_9BILA